VHRRGFGLAEFLVALAILIPVLVVTTGMFPYCHLVNYKARCISQAALVAQAETERLRNLSETTLADSTRTVNGDRVEFTVTSRITATGGARLKRAEVDVAWSDQHYKVVTLIEVKP
jgi:hypothetical protein